jgi:hypothetical protein
MCEEPYCVNRELQFARQGFNDLSHMTNKAPL